ncbi:MAG: O-antigen ligase family protein [Elusimicrobiota bacterium]
MFLKPTVQSIVKSKGFNLFAYYSFIFLFLVISLVPFNSLEIKIMGIPSLHFLYILLFIFVPALMVFSFLQNPHLNFFDKSLILLTIGFSMSFITSIDRMFTIRSLTGFCLKGIGVAFIADKLLKYKVKLAVAIFVICASLISLTGIIEVFSSWYLYPKPMDWPLHFVRSTIGNQLPFAAYLILFLPLSFLYMENKARPVKFLPFSIIVFAILLSFSRSGWFACFATVIIYYSRKKYFQKIIKNWIYVFSFIGIIGVLFFLIPSEMKIHFTDKFNVNMFQSKSFEHRLRSFITTKNIIKDYPLFGVGFGNYPKVHEKYRVEGVEKNTFTPDNVYLRFLCDTGIIGAGIFFVFIIYWMHKLWKSRDNPVVWAIFCGLAGFLINQLTADLFFWTAPQFVFWTLLGMGVGLIGNNGTGNQNG